MVWPFTDLIFSLLENGFTSTRSQALNNFTLHFLLFNSFFPSLPSIWFHVNTIIWPQVGDSSAIKVQLFVGSMSDDSSSAPSSHELNYISWIPIWIMGNYLKCNILLLVPHAFLALPIIYSFVLIHRLSLSSLINDIWISGQRYL